MNAPASTPTGQRKVSYGAGVLQKLTPSNIVSKVMSEARMALAPMLINRSPLKSASFELWDSELPYFLHRYNSTWRNERCIEVAAALQFLNQHPGGRCLEFGNVLANYDVSRPDVVVDLYERTAGVTNIDIVDFTDEFGFDLVVSLSTLEHVGWDESPRHPEKALAALIRLRQLLRPGGRCLISVPMGCNPALDEYICTAPSDAIRSASFIRVDGGWTASEAPSVIAYNSRGAGAASLWLAELGPLGV